MHVGSQGCPLDLLVEGARAVLHLAQEINAYVGSRQVRVLDLGGGLPVDYASDAPDAAVPERLTMARYARALREKVPEAFDETRWTLLTEFGRFVHAKCGLMLSTIEYVKSAGGRRIATVHCGADLFLRTCYQPEAWPHRVSAWGADGCFLDPDAAECDTWDVVGPLCFRGDIIAAARKLPASLAAGCAIAVHDAGAYTLAMFSKYNSRLAPPVYGWSEGGGRIAKLSDAETVDEALAMWQMPSRPACVLSSPHDPRCTPQ